MIWYCCSIAVDAALVSDDVEVAVLVVVVTRESYFHQLLLLEYRGDRIVSNTIFFLSWNH